MVQKNLSGPIAEIQRKTRKFIKKQNNKGWFFLYFMQMQLKSIHMKNMPKTRSIKQKTILVINMSISLLVSRIVFRGREVDSVA